MNLKIVIGCETAADVDAIGDVTISAFKTLEISGHTEQFIIAALCAAQSLTVSLVAEVDGLIGTALEYARRSLGGTQSMKTGGQV
jgi:putative acetyltransferase